MINRGKPKNISAPFLFLITLFFYLAGFALIFAAPQHAIAKGQVKKAARQQSSELQYKSIPLSKNLLNGNLKKFASSNGNLKIASSNGSLIHEDSSYQYHLTIDPYLQKKVEEIFRRFNPNYAALVAVEPKSGKILALASHSARDKRNGNLALKASFPAASIFKLVTLSAALDKERPVSPNLTLSYWGSPYILDQNKLFGRPQDDTRQVTLTEALGKSNNVVFGKLAINYIGPNALQRYANAFGFNRLLDFDFKVESSWAKIPADPLNLAKSAAGLGEATMSPIHGALIAAAIANGGNMMTPYIVEKVTNPRGEVVYKHSKSVLLTPINRDTAGKIKKMMVETITNGTSKKVFFDNRGKPVFPKVSIAGKTGSLHGDNPKGKYSWFVGFAPVDEPGIVLSALVINRGQIKLKSSFVARESFRAFFKSTGQIK